MRFFSYFLLMLFISTQTYGRDPFNKGSGATVTKRTEQHLIALCHVDEEAVADRIPFEQLYLIGILSEKDRSEALFVDQTQQVFTVKVGEFLALERLQLKAVSKQKVLLSQWKTNCEKPEIITLKL
ncbi:pilus assembly protein PilP [Actinobacillus porcinus]|uniref:pilus assembly protein PilP n=2 Tax=Actinobacillus porcinus TaxID=51048 RepID=UPI002A91CC9B|nr:pilus assembly protein PilP [Actinobacillus porcinus]MDY5422053.1 pilus assembly protein PilP [Actinobacillus porcinus]